MTADEKTPPSPEIVAAFRAKFAELEQDMRTASDELHLLYARRQNIRGQMESLRAAAKTFGMNPWDLRTPELAEKSVDDVIAEPAPDETGDESKSVRELVLQRLELAGPKGMKAADLRSHLERVYGIQTHEKTVGMTLYRLSKAEPSLARRDGTTWFFVPPQAEKKNPGGETPGQSNVFE